MLRFALVFALGLFGLVTVPVAPASAAVVGGVVAMTRDSCDYFLVVTKSGIDLLEWYGGVTPDRDDVIYGSFVSYGFHSVYDKTQHATIRVYVEEYGLDSGEAYDRLNDSCG